MKAGEHVEHRVLAWSWEHGVAFEVWRRAAVLDTDEHGNIAIALDGNLRVIEAARVETDLRAPRPAPAP